MAATEARSILLGLTCFCGGSIASAQDTGAGSAIIVNNGEYCSNPGLPIPFGDPAGVTDSITISGTGETVADLEVALVISHTWVSNLVVAISNSRRTVLLVDQPWIPSLGPVPCESHDDVDATLLDDAPGSIETPQCYPTPPTIRGDNRPAQPLAAFDGDPLDDTWTLWVIDAVIYDSGVVHGWCLTSNGVSGTGGSTGASVPATGSWGAVALAVLFLTVSAYHLRAHRTGR